MKRLSLIFAGFVLVFAGCASTVPTGTFNDKAAIGVQTVTLVRQSATALLTAKKITVEQDKTIQAQLDLVISSIKIAKSLEVNDPTNASAQLAAALEQLAALKTQTGVTP